MLTLWPNIRTRFSLRRYKLVKTHPVRFTSNKLKQDQEVNVELSFQTYSVIYTTINNIAYYVGALFVALADNHKYQVGL